MTNNWLVHIRYDSPQLASSDPDRIIFENDKEKMDEFFAIHQYNILSIDLTQQNSYQLPGKEIYILGKDFFQSLNLFNTPSKNPSDIASPSYMLEIYDKFIMGLNCIKDIAQQIGTDFYIKPHALRLKLLLERMGFNVIPKDVISEGGLFLKGLPPTGTPFLIVSHNFIKSFQKLKIELLKCPPNIGVDSYDTHIDTYLGIINFREELTIDMGKYNGILYVHRETLKKIQADRKKQDVWNILKSKMERKGYLIRIYEPETEYQNIGINFKFDTGTHTFLTNAFPKKERAFLSGLGITVIAPELSFGSNNSNCGGINCSYLLIPSNENIQKNIVNWIMAKVLK